MVVLIDNTSEEYKISNSKIEHCIFFIPSGHFDGWGKDSLDTRFIKSIENVLNDKVDIIKLPFLFKGKLEIGGEVFLNNQKEILKTFLKKNQSNLEKLKVSFISISLGSQILVSLLSEEVQILSKPNKCFFLSLTLENQVPLYSNVGTLNLYYGSNDWIAFIENDELVEAVSPVIYSQKTASNILLDKNQKINILIFDNHGHFLESSQSKKFSRVSKQILKDLLYE